MLRTFRPRFVAVALLLVAAFGIQSCGDDGPSGPTEERIVTLTLNPDVPAGAAAVKFTKAHVVVRRANGDIAVDTLINYPSTGSLRGSALASVLAQLRVQVELASGSPDSGEPFTVTFELINAAGVVVFSGGPYTVIAGVVNVPDPINATTSYTGPGADASTVAIAPPSGTVNAGGTFDFTAVVRNAGGAIVNSAPVFWTTLDANLVTVPDPGVGRVVAKLVRGTARIRATLINGATADANLDIMPVATAISKQAGDNQTGTPGAALPVPLTVKVVGGDGLGVSGVAVTFAIQSGGGSLSAAQPVTDADGLASVSLTLPGAIGTVTVAATAAGLSGSPLTFTATVSSGIATQLAFTTQPVNTFSGAIMGGVAVEARDQFGNRAAFNGTVTLSLDTPPPGVSISGTTTATAVNGVATFTNIVVTGNDPSVRLLATATGLQSAISGGFAVTPRPAVALTFVSQPTNVLSSQVFVLGVQAVDVTGTVVPTYTGTITLTLANAPSGVTLNGATSVAAVNGVATFAAISVSGTATGLTLVAAGTGITGTFASSPFNVSLPQNALVPNPTSVSATVQRTGPSPSASQIQLTSPGGPITSLAVGTIVYGGGQTNWLTAGLNATTTPATLTLSPTTTGLPEGTHTANVPITGSNNSSTSVLVTITVTPLPITQLAVIIDPAGATSGFPFTTQPVVEARDNTGTRVFGGSILVIASVASGPGTLNGGVAVNTSQGRATFTNLRIIGSGAHTLTYTSTGGVTSATSGSFNVVATPPTQLEMQTQPAGATSGVAFLSQPVVKVNDVNGNLVTTATNNVTASIASGSGTLGGTLTVAAVNGIATFTNLQITGLGAHTILFTSTGLTSITSNSFVVNPGAPASLAVFTQPGGAATGASLNPQPQIEVRDASGVRATNSSLQVTASKASGPGTLGGTLAVNAVNGLVTFTNLNITGIGVHSLAFAGAGVTGATSNNFTITAGAATQLAITTQPGNATSGAAFGTQPVVEIRDASGNLVTNATNSVTASLTTGTGTLVGTVTVSAVNGVATFANLRIDAGGAKNITFAATGLTSAVSASFTVAAGAASQLAITTQPGNATSGSNFGTQPVVQVRDAAGNLVTGSSASITATLTTGTGTLAGTVTINAVNGIATFTNLRIDAGGAKQLTFASTGLTSAVSSSFTVGAGAAAQLAVTQQPGGAAPGAPFVTQPIIEVQDAAGNRVTTSTASITATLSSGTGTLQGTVTISAVAGVATYTNLRIDVTGAKQLTFAASGLTSAVSNSFTVAAGVASQLAITTQPGSATSGAAFGTQPVVEVRDGSGNLVPSATNAVTATLTSGTGTLLGTVTVSAVNGVATFANLRIDAGGAKQITFSASGLTSAVSASFTVGAGAAAQLAVTQQPGSATSGSNFGTQPIVQVQDAAGNLVTTSSAAVTATLTTGTGTLAGTASINAVNGVATFTNLRIDAGGSKQLTFASAGLTSALSNNFTVGAGAASQLVISQQPGGASPGAPFVTQPIIQVLDAAGNLTNSAASITASLSSGTGSLLGTVTINASSGIATYTNLRIDVTGSKQLTFASSGLTSAVSNAFTVQAGVAAQLAITTQPGAATSGSNFGTQPVVEVRDGSGNLVNTATNNVTATLTTGSGTLLGTVTVAAVNGIATFTDLRIDAAGGKNITFSASGLTSAVSNAFTVAAGTATQLVITTQPGNATSGSNFGTQPVVQVRDAAGNVVTTSSASITASLTSGTGTLAGTVTINAVNGVATFTNLRIDAGGSKQLTFASGGLTSAVSNSFTVAAGAASQLVITQQPGSAASGAAFGTQPIVEVRDAAGNLVTGSSASVTASLTSGTGPLQGTVTVSAVSGVVTFSNLRIDPTGSKTLTFASTGLTSAVSNAFTVAAGGATQLAITTQPGNATSGSNFGTQPVVEVRDGSGNLVNTATNNVTATLTTGTGTLLGTVTVAAVNGVATFTNLRIDVAGGKNITFSASGLTSAVSNAFTVVAGAASQLVITQQPGSATSGSNFGTQPVVQVRDAAGNLVTGSSASITASISSGTGTLLGTVTINASSGIATFTNLRIDASGSKQLTFASTGLTSAVSNAFTVAAGAATQLVITTQPGSAASGAAFGTQPVIEVRDAAGNLTSSSASVTASLTSGTGPLQGTVTVSAVSGVVTFTNLRIDPTGSKQLTFASTGLTSAVSSSFTVSAGGATQLVLTTQPGSATAGAAFGTQPVLEVRDAANNLVTGSSASVTATLTSGTGTLLGTVTLNASGGIVTFTNLRIDVAGAGKQLTFASSGLTSAVSNSFTVAVGAASQIVITQQPGNATSGAAFGTQPVMQIRDASGNLVTTSSASVTATLTSGTGTLVGTTSVAASGGVVTFTNLRIDATGAKTLTFASSGLTSAVSSSFTVAAGGATQVVITTQPGSATSGAAFGTQPVVELRDAGGNLTGSTANVTATLTSGTGTLLGTATVAAVGGVATFTNLRIDIAGSKQLTFASTGLTSAVSSSFTVAAGAASQLVLTTQPGNSPASGVVFGGTTSSTGSTVLGAVPVLEIRDAAGNLVNSSATVTATINTGSGTLGGTVAVSASAGTATFTSLVITGTGAHTINFATTSPALSVNSSSFSVNGSITVNVNGASTANATNGGTIDIPINVDLSNRGSEDLVGLTVIVNWDPTKFSHNNNFVGNWLDNTGNGPSITSVNCTSVPGQCTITGSTDNPTIASFTLRTIRLNAIATGASQVTATVQTAGNSAQNQVPTVVRNVTVTTN